MQFDICNLVAYDKNVKNKFRTTPARKALFKIFADTTSPLSAAKIALALHERGIKVNKTTVYRELDFLLQQGVVTEVIINSGKKYYESSETSHHHHLICNSCGQIRDVVLENDLDEQMLKLENENSFKIQKHSLEFFGLCNTCR